MNQSFILSQIRKYNTSRRLIYQDAALTAIGIHVGLLEKRNVALRSLTDEERSTVFEWLREFCEKEGLSVTFKDTLPA